MNISRESIIVSSVRSFFVAFFTICGIFVGFIPIIIFAVMLARGAPSDIRDVTITQPIIFPDAEGNRGAFDREKPTILRVDIQGVIGEEKLTAESIREQLIDSRSDLFEDDAVKGILIYVKSPGGTVTDSDGIYRAIKSYKEKYNVPVYVYVDGLCASGGMYIAAAADKVFSTNVSIIGSVGVLVQFVNVSEAFEKIGIEARTLTMGKGKDDMNPLRPWGPGEDKSFRDISQQLYDQFVDLVVEGRPNISREKLVNTYGARVFSAPDALEYGFIDGIEDDINVVLKQLVAETDIDDDEGYNFVKLKEKHWIADIMEMRSPLITGKVSHEIYPFSSGAMKSGFSYLYVPGSPSAIRYSE
jgi:protease IV